jgi:hypothetical protein
MWNLVLIHLDIVLVSVHLEIVLVLVQDRCLVCTLRTKGSEVILVTPDGTPW